MRRRWLYGLGAFALIVGVGLATAGTRRTAAQEKPTEPLYTVNPFAEEGLAALFVTHPPLERRLAALRGVGR